MWVETELISNVTDDVSAYKQLKKYSKAQNQGLISHLNIINGGWYYDTNKDSIKSYLVIKYYINVDTIINKIIN